MTERMQEGIAQDIRGFTAQVRRGKREIVGTAFAISREQPLLLTCHHVVRDALSNKNFKVGDEVNIYFPQIRGDDDDLDKKLFISHVHQIIEGYEDDVVLLKLDREFLPSDVKVAILGDASQSVGWTKEHRFRSFGFQRLGRYEGLPARGIIVDFTSKASTQAYAPLTLETQGIDHGMSGAAVLDLHRNLVVGVVSETSVQKLKNADISFAVQSEVARDNWAIDLHPEYQLTMTQTEPPSEIAQESVRQVVSRLPFPKKPTYQPTQPPELAEWAGRAEILDKLNQDYADASVHLTGLIGFGGEGKSSIAYRWVTHHLPTHDAKPDAVFWWSFYEDRSFENLAEALTAYLYGEGNLEQIRGTAQRVHFIGAMAMTRRIVLVLDGFEVVQEPSGDKYGNIPNPDLKRLLEMFVQPAHSSFCLVTSRAPLLDFLSHTAYVQRDVTRLTAEDGRQLLKNLELEGDHDALDNIISDWEGHALTVSLVGTYLREQGKSAHDYHSDLFGEIENVPPDENPRYWRIGYVLRQYDRHLSEADKAFLKLFSVFRLPVAESAFERVFRTDTGSGLTTALSQLDDEQFNQLVQGLIERKLLRLTTGDSNTYSAHPLVQRHYRAVLEHDHNSDEVQPIHQAVATHYQGTAPELPSQYDVVYGNATPITLDDLKPYIEVVYHLCHAGAYDEAWDVFFAHINQNTNVIVHQLGAYETAYNLMLEFFSYGNTNGEPQVSNDVIKSFILNGVGFCLKNLGRLHDAIPFMERANVIDEFREDFQGLSIGYRNLTDLYLNLGDLNAMRTAAEQALAQSQQVTDERNRKQGERNSYGFLAWANHLLGHTQIAGEQFKQAEKLQQEIDPDEQYLYSLPGIQHADHLQRTHQLNYARAVTDANLKSCEEYGWIHTISQCRRILGDLDADVGKHADAGDHYDQAIMLAGQVDKVDVKIEAWLARGRWYAKHRNDPQRAFADLGQALTLAQRGEFRRYEADIRLALAWAHKADGDVAQARQEATIAKGMSQDMGYHWGQVDADEVLGAL